MSRMLTALVLLGLLSWGLWVPAARAQDSTTALKAKALAGEKLAPQTKAKMKSRAAGKSGTAGKTAAKRPPKSLQQQADELQIKSNALTSMMELVSDRRARCKKRLEMMTAYLKSIGKLKDYENSSTPPPSNKGEMSFRQAVNVAVAHARTQGSHCVDAPDQAEVAMLRRVCNANDRLAKKTWNEYAALRNRIRAMGAYLDSTGKTDDYKKWAGVEADKQAQAQAKAMQAEREKEVSAYKKRKARQQTLREEIAAQQRKDRQEALQRQFQLRQQALYNRMRERTATPGWCGWDDSYDEVYHNRPYYR
ncbi:MAG: hypothetical protein JW849_11245 [Phycisphaerae bacterium]|nr:hypothetical protein [Phycisphaerae bacterium]